jgi:hypothetical protein
MPTRGRIGVSGLMESQIVALAGGVGNPAGSGVVGQFPVTARLVGITAQDESFSILLPSARLL